MKKKLMGLCVLILALVSPAASAWTANAEQKTEKNSSIFREIDKSKQPSNENYELLVAENDCYEFMALEAGNIAVLNKQTGTLYESNPLEKDPLAVGINMTNLKSQLIVTWISDEGVTTTKNSTTDCVNKGWLTYQGIENGIIFYYEFQAAGITIPVEYVLEEDGLRVSILLDEIVEAKDTLHLSTVSLLPYFAAADSEAEGYTFVPDGSGALIYHNNDKASYGAYSQNIYGRDNALVIEKLTTQTQSARLPVFGMKNGNTGYLAVIEEGEALASVNAMTSGSLNSYNYVYASFTYRSYAMSKFVGHSGDGDNTLVLMKSEVTPTGKFSVKYMLLEKEGFDYVDMAEAYRGYLIDTYGLEKKKAAAPFYLNVLGGLEVEDYVFGLKINTIEELTTFSQTEQLLELLQALGISDLAVKYEGWQKGGMESDIPSNVRYENKLGGEKAYQSLAAYAEEKEIDLFLDFDFVNLYEGGNGISSRKDAVQTVGSTPAYLYTYNYNTLAKADSSRWKLLTPIKAASALEKMVTQKEKLYGSQIAVSTLGSMIYSDFAKKENGRDRTQAQEIWESMLALAAENFEQVMTANGNSYVIPYVSHIYSVPTSSSNYDIEDEAVPFYQIVLHGYVSYSTTPVNLDANPDKLVLKALETGSSLAACLMWAENHVLNETKYNTMFSANYAIWAESLAEYYAETKDILEAVAPYVIAGHEKLAENVYKTTYENGAEVYVNYNKKAVNVEGITVNGMGYVYKEE